MYDPPEAMLNGALVLALPVNVPPPMFVTVKVRVTSSPTAIRPKFDDGGVTEIRGGTAIPMPVTARVAPLPPVKFTAAKNAPPDVGLKRTVIAWFCPAVRLYDPPETMLYGVLVLAAPVSVPPPAFVTVKV